jgi:CheY-like chemotaxis protein
MRAGVSTPRASAVFVVFSPTGARKTRHGCQSKMDPRTKFMCFAETRAILELDGFRLISIFAKYQRRGTQMEAKLKRHVMIVDDSPICLTVATEALAQGGYEVVALSNPFDLGPQLRSNPPDLLLLDVTMPGIPGPELLRIARKRSPMRCPILLYSDRSDKELADLATSCGADGYVRKEANVGNLLRQVRRHIFFAPAETTQH